VSDHPRGLAGLGLSLVVALAACHSGAPVGPAPAACRHPAVVFRNMYFRSVAVYRPTVPYGAGGELLAELAPGDTSASIPLDRARGALLRDAVTGASVGEEHVKVVQRCLDAPPGLPGRARPAVRLARSRPKPTLAASSSRRRAPGEIGLARPAADARSRLVASPGDFRGI
jgi:hypothetical protein